MHRISDEKAYRFTIPRGTDFTAFLTDEEYFYGYFTFCKLLDIPAQAVEEQPLQAEK